MRTPTTSSGFRSLPTSLLSITSLSALLLSFSSPAAASFDCSDILAQKVHFNLKELGGPHIVTWEEPDLNHNRLDKYNTTIDLCNVLKWRNGGTKQTECTQGTQICAIRETVDLSETNNSTITPIDIAGTYPSLHGRNIDARFELLRNSKSHSDAGREGVRAELHGGKFGKVDQQAIVEFVCDKERTGLEGDRKDDGEKEPDDENGGDGDGDKDGDKDGGEEEDRRLRRRDDDKCEDSDASLRFCGYQTETTDKGKEVETLRLEWRTKYACEDAPDDSQSSHWGFFTWFIIILFLATATYLIFGSWLNYNRYGARGWDLLPHGDTIRDIPYILKDWGRRVKDTMQGPGSRGGYSAV